MEVPAAVGKLVVSRHASDDLAWVIASPKPHEACDDRAAAARAGSGTLLVIADGATGVGFGGVAADTFVEAILSGPGDLGLPERFMLADDRIAERGIDGDTTGIALVRSPDRIAGCSAGDSEAWFFPEGGVPVDLTGGQSRRPRIGNGAFPCAFMLPNLPKGIVVAGSDGFWRWTDPGRVADIVPRFEVRRLPDALLVDMLERFGPPDDDVTIAVMSV